MPIPSPSSDIAFSPSVKAVQTSRHSREIYARSEATGGFRTEITGDLINFLAEIDTAYLATASAGGRPYTQHRGGPKGFVRALDDHTLGFVDFIGNRQYITTGNLAENDQAFLFLMDYANQRRVKVWGRAKAVPLTDDLLVRLMPANYRARPEQAILFTVEAWDTNCRQHIPQKIDAAIVENLLVRIEKLEAENAALKGMTQPQASAYSTSGV